MQSKTGQISIMNGYKIIRILFKVRKYFRCNINYTIETKYDPCHVFNVLNYHVS
jgi:hypothetical protein